MKGLSEPKYITFKIIRGIGYWSSERRAPGKRRGGKRRKRWREENEIGF